MFGVLSSKVALAPVCQRERLSFHATTRTRQKWSNQKKSQEYPLRKLKQLDKISSHTTKNFELRASLSTESSETSVKARGVKKVESFIRLPVWPVVPGVIYIILDILRLKGVASALEAKFGGRVCPMMFTPEETDPFILCVHHRHSFWWWDPVRPIFRLLLPEGFPAHPHRGFETVTYMLDGALTHRDSEGVKQRYGKESVQWMTAGRGMLHEEMWDTDLSKHELYQIWVNLPAVDKMCPPRTQLLGETVTDGQTLGAIPVHEGDGCVVRVVGGEFGSVSSPVSTRSSVTVLRVTLDPGAVFAHTMPRDHSCMMYIRQGQAMVGGEEIQTFSTVFFDDNGEGVEVLNSGSGDLDFLLLGGRRLKEPIAAQGSMVMNTSYEIQEAYSDYSRGTFGVPWDHSISDEEWTQHVARHKSNMR